MIFLMGTEQFNLEWQGLNCVLQSFYLYFYFHEAVYVAVFEDQLLLLLSNPSLENITGEMWRFSPNFFNVEVT